MTRVAILGATGYGGGELLRFLLRHPAVEVVRATSRTEAGKLVGDVHRNLHGISDLRFTAPSADEIAAEADIAISALPHGAAAESVAAFADRGMRVLDLSGDFRLKDPAAYKKWYKKDHPRPDLLAQAVYGAPEANREAIRNARIVACPGCFATAINLALLPAASRIAGRASIVAMTGSSGSGADPAPGTHHPTRAETIRAYKVLEHQHTPEILQFLGGAGAQLPGIDFTPVSAPFVRGILAVAVAELDAPLSPADAAALYARAYAAEPFVKIVADREPEPGPIAGTNYAEIRARATEDGRLHVLCALDNLVKGGAGQGVQCLNIMLGLDERTALDWPGMWP